MKHPETRSSGQYLIEAHHLSLQEHGLQDSLPDEVQIVPRSTTICGSDLHYFFHGRNGSIVPKEPLCLGHESSGDVLAVGENVTTVKVGDRVAIEAGVPCGVCQICSEGQYNLCPGLRFRGSAASVPHFQGMLQERINHPSRWVHQLPSTLTHEHGALLEPLAVAIHAVRRASVEKDQSCLVFGAGAVGLLCAAAAKHAGSGPITIVDIDEGRLAFAVAEGYAQYSHTVKPVRGNDIAENLLIAKELASDIHRSCGALQNALDRPRCTFECSGVEACVQASIFATRSGGKVLLVGMGTPNQTLPISEASAREISLIPTWRYYDCYPEAIRLMALSEDPSSGLPNLRKLITHRFSGLETLPTALETAKKTRDESGSLVIKVAINSG